VRKILSIDGGGIKGVFPAAFLAELEKTYTPPIGQYFDLIAGTSTGGIIALGLGAGFSAKQILRFYEQYGPKIFERHGLLAWLSHLVVGKHRAEPLRDALVAQFGQAPLGASRTRLVIPSQNLETGEVYIFKTAHHERFKTDYKKSMVDAAMATSAAPTYFPVHALQGGTPVIDGGLWANNPAGVAAVETIGVLGWSPAETLMLSLSCTAAPLTTNAAHRYSLGRVYWAFKALSVITAGQSSAALGTAQLLLGHANVTRVAPNVAPGVFKMDGTEAIERLKGLGQSEARKAVPQLVLFFQKPAEQFIPIYR
jgi:predicted acylesterase/phospholipase RssA